MKRKILVVIFAILALFESQTIKTSANSVNFVNRNGISISESEYDKLIGVGYTEKEILSLGYEEFTRIIDMQIVNTFQSQYVVKTTKTEDGEGIVVSTDEIISEQQALSEIENENESDNINFTISTNAGSCLFEYCLEPGNPGSGSTNPTVNTSVTTEYKYLTVSATHYKYSGGVSQFFVKVNLEWLKLPAKRLVDIISINFSNNVEITSESIEGVTYPAFSSKFMYDEEYESHSRITPLHEEVIVYELTPHTIIVDGDDVSDYSYKNNQGLAVKYELPDDISRDLSNGSFMYYYTQNYSNMFLTLSANFVPKQAGTNFATFAGCYVHQTGSGSVRLDRISLSTSEPFFNYNKSLLMNPSFDSPVAGVVSLSNLG